MGGRGENKNPKPNRAQMKAEELVGVEGRQQPGPGAKANTVPKGGREQKSLGKWPPSL